MATLQAIRGLDTLMDGALNERFEREWSRLMSNVFDPNTDPKAKRTINITIEVKPSEDRMSCQFVGKVVSRLAPCAAIVKPLYIEMDDCGRITASEMTGQVPGQIDMDGNVNMPNVIHFDKNG